MVNWAPKLQTAVSDLEVEYSEEQGILYFFKYDHQTYAMSRQATSFLVGAPKYQLSRIDVNHIVGLLVSSNSDCTCTFDYC